MGRLKRSKPDRIILTRASMRTAIIVLLIGASPSLADPCVSGLQPGQKPGPYSFLVATGPQRGQQTCYVCETADKPAIVIFARKLSDPLGKLMVKCDAFMESQPKDSVRSWATVLGEKTANLDELARWSKGAGVKNMPIGVFDDPIGPPAFKLNEDAEITVLLWVNRKVVANFAYRASELNDEAIKKIAETMPKLVQKK
jgi:hypothetical protein